MNKLLCAAASIIALAGCETANLTSSPIVESSDGQDRRAEIINDTPETMMRVRVQNAATGQWSENILVGRIRKNSSKTVLIDDGTGQCLYNFTATMEGGQTITRRGLDVCTLASWRIFRG
ncbi:MAG: hypothetical protein COB08_001360 [Rhodobacteraceae bacterium]|nr:hypothetical protein [Paracoccaceae bacterium]